MVVVFTLSHVTPYRMHYNKPPKDKRFISMVLERNRLHILANLFTQNTLEYRWRKAYHLSESSHVLIFHVTMATVGL